MESILYTQYKQSVIPRLQEKFALRNVMQVPKITKVTMNVGYGRHVKDKAFID